MKALIAVLALASPVCADTPLPSPADYPTTMDQVTPTLTDDGVIRIDPVSGVFARQWVPPDFLANCQ